MEIPSVPPFSKKYLEVKAESAICATQGELGVCCDILLFRNCSLEMLCDWGKTT